jgi:hypothetical protein
VALCNVDILVRSGPEVDPYISILMPDPPIEWQRAWFFPSNDTDVSVHAFMGHHPIPHPI